MKVYEKLGIDPTTKEGMEMIVNFDCSEIPENYRKCQEFRCTECISTYLTSEVPEIDWSKVPEDTPVIVWDYDPNDSRKRYFYHFNPESKLPYACFDYGSTSWSAGSDFVEWKHCKLAFPEQAKEEWYK